MTPIRRILFFVFLSGSYLHGYAQLNTTEKKIMARVKVDMNNSLQLLAESVNINSGTLNTDGVKKVGSVYAGELQKLGFTIEWVNEPDSLQRAGHLVATHAGKKGKRILLLGHLDTVFEPDMPIGPYKLLNDSTATGQGVIDMKGGDVMIIAALQALESVGQLKDMNLLVYFTGDEEKPGSPNEVARADFIERAKNCDIALGFEASAGLHYASAARRGFSSWALNVKANTGHSSGIFSDSAGYGAIFEAARILNRFREELDTERYLTFNPGMIVGGTEVKSEPGSSRAEVLGKINIIAPVAEVTGDLRFISEAQKNLARKKMQAIVAESLPGTSSIIHFQDGGPAMEPTERNLQLLKELDQTSREMGIGETLAFDPGLRGAGDISDIAQYVACLDGLGSSGSGAHEPGETIRLKEYPVLIQRAAIFIYRLTR